jgi:hypothetical protein
MVPYLTTIGGFAFHLDKIALHHYRLPPSVFLASSKLGDLYTSAGFAAGLSSAFGGSVYIAFTLAGVLPPTFCKNALAAEAIKSCIRYPLRLHAQNHLFVERHRIFKRHQLILPSLPASILF